MMTQPFEQFEQHGVLTNVREGMTVYDRAGRKVGTVERVYMGNTTAVDRERGLAPATSGPPGDRADSWLEDRAEVVAPQDARPEVLRERLRRHGYVAIDGAGIFTGTRFATPAQIAGVTDDGVTLNVAEDELIKR